MVNVNFQAALRAHSLDPKDYQLIDGRNHGLYVSYNERTGYSIVSLNIIERFLRAAFGFYADTHLDNVVMVLSSERNLGIGREVHTKVAQAWMKTYPENPLPSISLRTISTGDFANMFSNIMFQLEWAINTGDNVQSQELFKKPADDREFHDLKVLHRGLFKNLLRTTTEDAIDYSVLAKEMVEEFCYRAQLIDRDKWKNGEVFAYDDDLTLIHTSLQKLDKVIKQHIQARKKVEHSKKLPLGEPEKRLNDPKHSPEEALLAAFPLWERVRQLNFIRDLNFQ